MPGLPDLDETLSNDLDKALAEIERLRNVWKALEKSAVDNAEGAWETARQASVEREEAHEAGAMGRHDIWRIVQRIAKAALEVKP